VSKFTHLPHIREKGFFLKNNILKEGCSIGSDVPLSMRLYNYNTDPNGGFNYDKYRSAYDSDEEFDKAGYHPLRDDNEEKYNEKLKENRLEIFYIFGLLIILLIPLIIIFVIVKNKQNRRLDQIFVEEMESINKKKK
jgi:hypothetical protein